MSRARVSRDAKADLDETWLYVAQRDGVEAAQRHIERLTSKFALLAGMPEMGRRRDELKPGIRSHPVGDYIIYYRFEKSIVTILRVVHGARDIESLFR